MRIQVLPPLIANQIAAGEVIERPASVVKELLENAYDAGATQITIDIGFGGLNSIKVDDNGAGIVAEDLPLAVAAHATSKISGLDDLYQLQSMGFRGEALASIAAVSRVTLISKPQHQDYAKSLTCQNGHIELNSCARTQGTTIEVRDLFYNAPVRKKFLKSEQNEYQAIESLVKRFALSAPHIAILLIHNGKTILQLANAHTSILEQARVKKLFGKSFYEQSVYVESERAGMRLRGWLGMPAYQRSQSDKLWIYMNGRMVKDRLLLHALKQAYADHLYPGRYPACILYLTLPPEEVDVNVHPTKHEVRFEQPRLVHDFILSRVQEALGCKQNTWSVSQSQPERSLVAEPTRLYQPLNYSLSTDPLWVVLNNGFVLTFLNDQPYLFELKRVQQGKLLADLMMLPRPFTSRRLLVPLTYPLDSELLSSIDQYKSILLEFGLILQSTSQHVMITSLPEPLPYLNLAQCINGLIQIEPQAIALLHWLVACHDASIALLQESEQKSLVNFLQAQDGVQLKQLGCQLLDEQRCRELIYA